MARSTLGDIFDKARLYLDTDPLNFPDELCDILLKRIWYQAVTMEREWRFFQKRGVANVTASSDLVPFTFLMDDGVTNVDGVRIYTVRWNGTSLVWAEYTTLLKAYGDQSGTPYYWTELNDGLTRNVRLFPITGDDGVLTVDFYLEPQYPTDFTLTFADLPEEFDDALLEGLLAEMYMREEDPDLYASHRQNFLDQMGSIRSRWKVSIDTPLVVGGYAKAPDSPTTGFADNGAFTAPAMR